MVEYQPKKTARDEEREKDMEELERRREERRIWEEKKLEEKAKLPKKKIVRKEEWEVEAIKGKKVVRGETFYLVKFEGYDKTQWEPEANVEGCDKLIDDFEREDEKRKKELEERRKREEEEGAYEVARILDVKIKKVILAG